MTRAVLILAAVMMLSACGVQRPLRLPGTPKDSPPSAQSSYDWRKSQTNHPPGMIPGAPPPGLTTPQNIPSPY